MRVFLSATMNGSCNGMSGSRIGSVSATVAEYVDAVSSGSGNREGTEAAMSQLPYCLFPFGEEIGRAP
ncbi:hypothetical protein SALBM311S_01416 [Streptomyces alboniger]